MADEAEALELDTPIEGEEPVIEEGAEQQQPEEFSIEIEGEESADEPELVKHLRAEVRARDRQIADMKVPAIESPVVVGDKPTLESCEWDEEKFERDLFAWKEREAAAREQTAKAEETTQANNRVWQLEYSNYKAKAAVLPVPDFQAAEDTVTGSLPLILQSAIVKYARDPAKVVYALAKHPAKLTALAAETDPVRFILAMREMEDKLVVNKRKPPEPEAETIQSGSAPLATTPDKESDRLYKEGMKNNDMSAYMKRQRELRKAARG